MHLRVHMGGCVCECITFVRVGVCESHVCENERETCEHK